MRESSSVKETNVVMDEIAVANNDDQFQNVIDPAGGSSGVVEFFRIDLTPFIRFRRRVRIIAGDHGDVLDGRPDSGGRRVRAERNDLLVSEIIRTNEKQAWFVSQHLTDVPLVNSQP